MNEYEVTRKLTSGGQGSTCEARDKRSNAKVVIKLVACDSINSGNNALQECKMLQSLSHPHIVAYLDFFIHQDEKTQELLVCTVMEFCKHGDLSRHLKTVKESKKRLPEGTVLRWIEQITSALGHLHSQKIIHRDVKPHNVFITADGKMKMGDFGLASNTQRYKATSTVGTPCYFAPEVLQKEDYGNAIDMWGVGCILYEVMTLDFLWARKGMISVQVMSKPFRPSDFPQDFSFDIRELTCLLLDSNSRRRPTAAASQETVTQILKNSGHEGAVPAMQPAMQRQPSNRSATGAAPAGGVPAAPARHHQHHQQSDPRELDSGPASGGRRTIPGQQGSYTTRRDVTLDDISNALKRIPGTSGTLVRYMKIFEETRLYGKNLADAEDMGTLIQHIPISNPTDKQAVVMTVRTLLKESKQEAPVSGNLETPVSKWLKQEGFRNYLGVFTQAGVHDLATISNLNRSAITSLCLPEMSKQPAWEDDMQALCHAVGELQVKIQQETRYPGTTGLGPLLASGKGSRQAAEPQVPARGPSRQSSSERAQDELHQPASGGHPGHAPQTHGHDTGPDEDGLFSLNMLLSRGAPGKHGGRPPSAQMGGKPPPGGVSLLTREPSIREEPAAGAGGKLSIQLRLIEIVNSSILMQNMFLVIVVARASGDIVYTEETIQLTPQPTDKSLMRFHLNKVMDVPKDKTAGVYFEVRHIKGGKPAPTKYWAFLAPGCKERGDCMLQMYKAPTIYDQRKQKNTPKQGSRFHVTVA
uniref:non-specific serine/threonine protein kinase n=1 Tax=Hemiselmis tepida TaxID=464990 RepID=A0A7S0YX26_9CRYP|mmetsp:Transcript_28682/g.72671  ORF Transcript_28682/g.72671 Transcript_28682/m.72671 type:complete len:755 (+) Transcript_28682:179-2443(+)